MLCKFEGRLREKDENCHYSVRGTNCDMDVLHVLKDVVGVDAETVWYKEESLTGFDGVVVPGGFSYGDYLRAGAIAARTPIMDSIKKIASEGKPVLVSAMVSRS